MARDGTVFKARMKEDTHMDCFYPKAEKKENEVYFYRECREPPLSDAPSGGLREWPG